MKIYACTKIRSLIIIDLNVANIKRLKQEFQTQFIQFL